MIDVTKEAYEYAVKVKKVNEGVIEAYKSAYNKGYNTACKQSDMELLELIKGRYRDARTIHEHIGHSGGGRGVTEKEGREAQMHELIRSFCEQLTELDEKLNNK